MQTFYQPPVRVGDHIPQAGQANVPSGLESGHRRANVNDALQVSREPVFSPALDEEQTWYALAHASNPSGYTRLGENPSDPGLVPLGVPQPDSGQSGSSARARPADWTVEEGWGLNDLVAQRRCGIVTLPNPFYRNGYWRPFGQPVAQIRYPLVAPGHAREQGLAMSRVAQLHALVYEQPQSTILSTNLAAGPSMVRTRGDILPVLLNDY